ncbi:MAG TPA: hypothetical protein VFN09_11450 [Rhodanobacteraceae bacterium]|nr:hypothetical protein [Rhodanobacteraceae bacterium]
MTEPDHTCTARQIPFSPVGAPPARPKPRSVATAPAPAPAPQPKRADSKPARTQTED